MKNFLLTTLVLCAIFFLPVSAFAADRQEVTLTISPDTTAIGVWKVPTHVSYALTKLYVPEYRNYGYAAGTKYTLTSIVDSGKQSYTIESGDENSKSFSPGYKSQTSATINYHFTYKITPSFQGPIALYEIWIADNLYRNSPVINATFPPTWKLVSTWPAASSTATSLSIPYPDSYSVKPVVLAFATNYGGSVETHNGYTISGTYDEIQKIKLALQKIPSADTLMQQYIGLPLPKNIIIMSDDISKGSVFGGEVGGVAVHPNIVILNNKTVQRVSPEEVAELLAHEFAHLAMGQVMLFRDKNYDAPWFNEGVAVYVETKVHNSIYTDKNKKILVEELNRTHTVSPTGANALYQSKFDFGFDGTQKLGTFGAYLHSGLVFSFFGEKVGATGFKQLFNSLKNASPQGNSYHDSLQITDPMRIISGYTDDQLLFPGRGSETVKTTVSRISQPDNDEELAANLVANYIQNNIKHYFGVSGTQAATNTAIPADLTQTSPLSTGSKLTLNLSIGSKGSEVVTLQSFLEKKGLLVMPAGVAKGFFGSVTAKAVIQYQKSKGISQTGTIGPKTRASINSEI